MQSAISSDATVVVSTKQFARDLSADEVVILNVDSGVYYGLKDVGARIWGMIQTPKTVAEIRDTILEEYEVEPDRCETDLSALLQRLAAEGLIEIRR